MRLLDMTRILRDNKINNRKYNLVEEESQKEIKNRMNN